MTKRQFFIHDRAQKIAQTYLKAEFDLVDVLGEVEKTRLYREMDKRSLFQYATESLGLSEAVSYICIGLARKSREVPELGRILRERKLSVSKAAKVVSVITRENSSEILNFAVKSTARQIEAEVARRNPKSVRDKIKPISEGFVQMTFTVSKEAAEDFARVQSLLAKKATRPGDCFELIVKEFLERKDPVKRAQRILMKKLFTGKAIHVVNLRDQGKCTVCASDKFTEIHHIVPKHQGGSDEASNLMTLCWHHHRQAHD